jgi:hypothetical protein
VIEILLFGEKECISSATWIASSLVGQRIIAFVVFAFGFISCKSGIPKEAVFQVPVWACPMISFSHCKKTGITFSWIGEGNS